MAIIRILKRQIFFFFFEGVLLRKYLCRALCEATPRKLLDTKQMSVWLESRRPPTFWTFYCFHISDDTRTVWGFVTARPTNETICEGRELTHRECTGCSCVTVVWCGGPGDERVDRFRLAQNLNEIKKFLPNGRLSLKRRLTCSCYHSANLPPLHH